MNKEDIDYINIRIENIEKNIKELREISIVSKEIISKIINKIEETPKIKMYKPIRAGWWWSA